jgi:hypothetical protein
MDFLHSNRKPVEVPSLPLQALTLLHKLKAMLDWEAFWLYNQYKTTHWMADSTGSHTLNPK